MKKHGSTTRQKRKSPSWGGICWSRLRSQNYCEKHGLQPTVFYRWQKEFFENGTAAFQPKARPNHSAEQERIDYLEKKIQTKDEVLAELMAEHVALKKTLGEL